MSDNEDTFTDQTRETLIDSIQSRRNELLSDKEKRVAPVRKGKSAATLIDDEQEARFNQDMQDLDERSEGLDDSGHVKGATLSTSTSPATLNPMPVDGKEPILDLSTDGFVYPDTGFKHGASNPGKGRLLAGAKNKPVSSSQHPKRDVSSNAKGPGATSSTEKSSASIQFLRDQELAERLTTDNTIALSIHDEESRSQALDQESLMLAIELANSEDQTHPTFTHEQDGLQEDLLKLQNELDCQQEQMLEDRRAAFELRQLLDKDLETALPGIQADRELALRLHRESSIAERDAELARILQQDFDNDLGRNP